MWKSGAIFVSVASYRDEACSNTLESMFTMASRPDLIFAGVCQQNKSGDPDCISEALDAFKNNIRIMRLDYTEARGPTFARYHCSQMWDGEEYFFQIDSHTRFVQDWDVICKSMYAELLAICPKPIISHYPLDSRDTSTSKPTTVPRMCRTYFDTRGMLTFSGAQIRDSNNEFYQTPFVSGNMIFAKSDLLREVPYDPSLLCLFTGEEILLSARFYTSGYDVFTPRVNVIYHEYIREGKSKFWDEKCDDTDAHNKVKYLLGILDESALIKPEWVTDAQSHGMGTIRSIEQFRQFAGIDTVNKLVYSNFCEPNNEATEHDIRNSNEANVSENYAIPSVNLRCHPKHGASCRKLTIIVTVVSYVIAIIFLVFVIYLIVKH